MTNYNTIRDQITEQAENAPFLNSNGFPIHTGTNDKQTPFYIDTGSNGKLQLNFGYGIDITQIGSAAFINLLNNTNIT